MSIPCLAFSGMAFADEPTTPPAPPEKTPTLFKRASKVPTPPTAPAAANLADQAPTEPTKTPAPEGTPTAF